MNLPSIGNYDLIKEIGNGATSTVFYAIHRPTGVPVAVKAINLPTERPLAEKETAILKKLSHPCICEFYEVIYSDEKAYLAMELVDQAKDLLKYVNLRGKVGESEARTILSQLMCVIQYLHSNKIVHRDIKLENILLAESGKNNFIIKIIDFGMSHQCSNENNAMSTHCGSLAYIAPEVLKKENYTNKVDVWSAGVVLYTLCTGQYPFYHENHRLLMEQIMNQPIIIPNDMSPSLANLLMKMLNKDPNSRLTVNEVLSHPWVNQTSIQKKIHTNEVSIVNHDVILKMVEKGYSREIIIKKLLDEVVDDDTITYKILKRQIINEKMFNKSPNNSSIISDKTTKSLLTLNTIMNSKHNFSYINNNFRRGMVLRDNKQQTSIHFGNQVSLNNSNRFFHSTTRLIKLETMKGPT